MVASTECALRTALQWLAEAGPAGITIAALFGRLKGELDIDETIASAVWEDLKTKDYIACRLGDGELRRLSSSPLGKLELSELSLVGLGSKEIFHNPGQLLGKRKASTELASPPTKRRSISPAADPPDISASTPKISDQAPAITSSDESSSPSRVLSADTPADPSMMASSNPRNGSHSSDESSSSLRKLPPKAHSIPAAVSPSTPAKDLQPTSSPTSSIDSAPQGTLSNPSLQTAHQPDVPAQATTNIEPISTTSVNTWHTMFHGPRLALGARPHMSHREIGRGAAARFPQAIIKTSRGGGLRRPMFPEFAPVRTYISPYSRPIAPQHSPPPLANTPTVLSSDSYVAPPSTFAEATHAQSDFGQPHSPSANSFMSQSIGHSTQTPVAQYNYSYDTPANALMSQSTGLSTQTPLGQQSHFYAPPPNASESQSIGFSTQAPVAQYVQVSAYLAVSAEQHVSPYVQISPYANGSAQQPIPTPSTSPSQLFIPAPAFGSNDQKLWSEALVPPTIQQPAQSLPPSISGPKTRKPRKRRSPPKKSQQARQHHVEDEGNRMETNFQGQLQGLDSGRKRTIAEADSQGTPNQKRQRISENISQAKPLVLPEYVAALPCIWSETRGHLVLLKDQSSLEFYSLDEPSPNAPMIALPIRNLTENPILSTPGSDPMEIHIKTNDSRGEEITFRFAFDFTDGKGVALPDIMVQSVRSAIVSVRFGQKSDLPRVDNVEDEFGSNDDLPGVDDLDFAVPSVEKSGKAGPAASQPSDNDIHQNFEKPNFPRVETAQNPEGYLHANVETPGLSSTDAAENFDPKDLQQHARETQPGATKGKQVKKVKEVKAKKPKTTYTCSKCGNTYLQSWGLSYHLNKSNTPCNPNADLTLYEAKKARREKRNISKKLRRSMTQNEDSETESQGQQADLKSTSRPQTQFQGAADNIDSMMSRPKRERKPKKQFAGVVTIPSETFQLSALSGHQIDQSPSTPTAEPNETPKKRATSKKAAHTELEEAEQSDSSAGSVDSAVEFYQAHATTGVERPRKVTFADHPTTTPSKKAKALPFENYVLQEIAAQMAVAPPSAEPSAPSQSAETTVSSSSAVEASSVESSSVVQPSSAVEASSTEPSSAVELSSAVEPSSVVESINTKASAMMLCEDILISLVQDNEGFFPGDKSIWIAFVNVWFRTRKPQTTSMLPMSTLCIEGVQLLVEKKKLRSEHFTWTDSKKREVTRTILTSPNYNVSSEHIDALKMLFQQFHPNLYVPVRFAPPEPILTRLNELATRKVPMADRERFRLLKSAAVESDSESEVQSPIQLEDESSEDEFVAGGIDEEEVEELDQLQDDMVELDGSKKRTRKPTRKRTKDGEKLSRPRDQRHNKAISEGVRRNWALRKAAQTKDFFPNRKMARARKPISQEEKDRRAETAYYNRRAWDFQTPAFLPNPETGAWDVDAKPIKSKRGGTRHMKPKIPHPITYMQAPDGAWSFQPAGHGAKPVFARPLRRADEEGSYLKRTNRTHRPVIFPTKNRKFLPANPSKKLLGQPLASKRRVSTDASKITRKPKRKSTRKNPVASRRTNSARSRVSKNAKKKKVRPNNDIFPVFVPTPAVETKRKKKDKIVVNEADILNFFEPKKLLPDAPRNVGLASIPQAFGLLASLYEGPDVAVHQYRPDYHNLVFVEPKFITGGERPSLGSWTVGIWRPIQSGSVSLRWDEATAVDMETVPYSKLDFGRDDEIHDKRPGPKRGSQRYKLVPIENITMEQRFKYTRVLTALPNDLKGLIKDPQDAIKKLGVELAKPNRATESNRRIKGSNAILSKKAEFKLIITVVIVRALTGGLDCRIDWVIVSQLFQDYTCNFLMKFWKTLQIPKRELIECIHEDFRKVFVQAYKNNEVPSINYDYLSDYQWATLVNWVMTHKDINTSLVKQRKPLPSSRVRVEKQFDVKPVPKDLKLKPWRELYHKEGTANYLRVQMATSEPRVVRSIAIHRKKTFEALFRDEFRLLRSWIRATALTPAEDYDSKVAQKKLLSIATKEVIKETLATLQERKVLLKSSRVRRFFGCIFEVGSAFLTPLTKMDLNVEQFIDAATAKSHLDDSFRASGKSVKHEYLATVGNLVAVTSMQAHQRIRLDASRWPSEGKKFGMNEDGGYETRKIDPVKYIFDITIEPVPDKYVYDSDNAEIDRFLMAEPPLGPATGELPIWRGITGKLNRDIWKRVLAAVGSLVGNRAGINIRTLMEHFSPTFEGWELCTLMDWGVENGLFKVVQPGIEGWTVTEWWWLAIGKKCDDGIPLGRGK